jgi:S-adenosylmethionine:tRNA ribosyltransferase-isomerase
MQLSDFDYHLPEDRIAQEPPPQRDAARMLVVYRAEQRFEDRRFREFPSFMYEGDCLVLNESRVLPSRLFSGKSEMLLLEPLSADGCEWKALVRPGRKLQPGVTIRFDEHFAAEIIARGERGERTVRFLGIEGNEGVYAALDRLGHMPLPPYIKRQDRPEDRDRYQTVFARERGSAAAPTAGLHFTGEILGRVREAGAHIAKVTLHVGLGTFQPLDREDFENHKLHHERYSMAEESARDIESAERVIAVGTTSVRTLESYAASHNLAGSTDLFIYPGYRFQRTDAMLTNFHLPRTSLLLLVCAFAGTELALAAYRHAVEQRYRFFSYGDCMLIL